MRWWNILVWHYGILLFLNLIYFMLNYYYIEVQILLAVATSVATHFCWRRRRTWLASSPAKKGYLDFGVRRRSSPDPSAVLRRDLGGPGRGWNPRQTLAFLDRSWDLDRFFGQIWKIPQAERRDIKRHSKALKKGVKYLFEMILSFLDYLQNSGRERSLTLRRFLGRTVSPKNMGQVLK